MPYEEAETVCSLIETYIHSHTTLDNLARGRLTGAVLKVENAWGDLDGDDNSNTELLEEAVAFAYTELYDVIKQEIKDQE